MSEILKVKDLKVWFPAVRKTLLGPERYVKAVDGVSFSVRRGETMGVVGESGSGKSTLGQCCIRLLRPTSGSIEFDGQDITHLSNRQLRALRSQMQIVFQDPYSSLNPRMRVSDLIAEPLDAQILLGGFDKRQRKARVAELVELVGLQQEHMDRYPHEFSGGQRQRICIARALAMNPRLIVCDEAVSALDVSIQAQIINLLEQIKKQTGVSYLFISHDLAVVRHISDRIMVLYLGEVLELAESDELYLQPIHPYTRTLLNAIPIPDPDIPMNLDSAEGDMPSPIDKPAGCCFCTRCPQTQELCRTRRPELREVTPGHFCACHFAETVR